MTRRGSAVSQNRDELVREERGGGGLPLLRIHNAFADCDIYRHGAHVSSFVPRGGRDLLWLSPYSRFEEGMPIRGGIPLIFPWFSEHRTRKDLQLHGFVRIREWNFERAERLADGSTRVSLSTEDDEATRAIWPQRFGLTLDVTVGSELRLELSLRNLSKRDFSCESGFHTYCAVGNAQQCQIVDFDGIDYIDRAHGDARAVQRGPVCFGAETIQAYMRVPERCELDDMLLGRRIRVRQEGLGSVVLWNPGRTRAEANDEIRDSWQRFVCIESTNCLERAITVPARSVWKSAMSLSVGKD